MNKLIIVAIIIFSGLISAQSVTVKNSADAVLLDINDEATDGSSLTLPSGSEPSSGTTNKLYNVSGTLNWNGSALGNGLWTLNTPNIYFNTGKVGIGTTNPGVKLTVSSTTSDAYIRLENTTHSKMLNLYSGDSGSTTPYVDTGSPSTPLRIQPNGGETHINAGSGGNVGIGTTSPQGVLDVTSTSGALIVPRMTESQRDGLPTVNGSIIYNTDANQFNFVEDGTWVTK